MKSVRERIPSDESKDMHHRVNLPQSDNVPLIAAPPNGEQYGWSSPFGVMVIDAWDTNHKPAVHNVPYYKEFVTEMALLVNAPIGSVINGHHDDIVRNGLPPDQNCQSVSLRDDVRHSPLSLSTDGLPEKKQVRCQVGSSVVGSVGPKTDDCYAVVDANKLPTLGHAIE